MSRIAHHYPPKNLRQHRNVYVAAYPAYKPIKVTAIKHQSPASKINTRLRGLALKGYRTATDDI